jgi:membrane protease subunit HflC
MMTRLSALVGALIVAALILVFSMLFEVQQTERALVLQFGEVVRLIEQPGLQIKWPWQNVVLYDRRLLDFEPQPEEVIAGDQKRLVVDAYARFRITDPLQFYQTAGTEAAVRNRLGSIMTGSLRRVIGNVDLQAVVSNKRAAIMRQIRDEVNAQAKGFGIDVVDVRIRHADLPVGNSQAVYDRMKSERQREATQFRVDGENQATQIHAMADRIVTETLAQAQKDSQVLRGQGDAESIRISADAFEKDPAFFAFYRSLQAYRDALSGGNTSFVLAPDGEFFKYLENGPSGALGVPSAAAPAH